MSQGTTVLGPSIEIEGEIEGGENLVIRGAVNGRIVSREDLTIEQSGRVQATIETKNLAVVGEVTGDVSATERIEIKKEGKMLGDVKAPRVLIADGARFKGHIDMDV